MGINRNCSNYSIVGNGNCISFETLSLQKYFLYGRVRHLDFLISLDFGLAINEQQFKSILNLSKNIYTRSFMEFINWNVPSVFIILALLGIIFLFLALKVEKSFKEHFTSGTEKPFFTLIGSIVCMFFCSITNLFMVLLPLF